jgi:hypothetical protein
LTIELIRRRAQTGRDHCVFQETGQPALPRRFLPQISGRATFREHSTLAIELITRGNAFGSRDTKDNVQYGGLVHTFGVKSGLCDIECDALRQR